jgi:L-ornithine Nalpha-acyltransferase
MISRVMARRRAEDRFNAPMRLAGMLVPALKAGGFRLCKPAINAASKPLGRLGALEVRLAHTAAEIRDAQKLRFNVFYREMSAVADAAACLARRDVDLFDALCDHLLVIDHAAASPRGRPAVIGTSRLLRQDMAERCGGFYSAGEFDLGALLARHRESKFLELGRSCVLPAYRNGRTLELMWHGIWTYVLAHRISVMIGCASLEGTDPDRLALPLSFLHHYARAPEVWRAAALPRRHITLNRMPKAAVSLKKALALMPPLIKGYLRLGAYVGDGAVVDRQFGTTDVLIVLPVSAINSRYVDHFGPGAERHAA